MAGQWERVEEDSNGTTVWTGSTSELLCANWSVHLPTLERDLRLWQATS